MKPRGPGIPAHLEIFYPNKNCGGDESDGTNGEAESSSAMLVDAMLANANQKGEGLPGPRQRLTSVERRAAIVSAALDLFAQHGFRGTTTRELAAVVGVSEPVLYQHFATKRELYTAIVDAMMAEGTSEEAERLQELSKADDERTFFVELAKLILDWHHRDERRIRLLLYSALEGHELAELWQERATQQILPFIEQYIARRARAGALAVAQPAIAARCFMNMLGHHGMMSVIFKCPLPDVSPEDVVESFVDIFLNGIRNT
jgi:AcrR family transcriptional regulator